MQINPKSKSVTYGIGKIELVEEGLNDIEKECLSNDDLSPEHCRSIVAELNFIRQNLCLAPGVKHHEKFIPSVNT